MKPLLLIAWTAFLSIIIAPAQAQTRVFPAHPVRIIVATSAGSGADVMSRLLGQKLSELWGQPVVIENQSGASGNIGANMVARAASDGHVMLMATVNHTINKALTPNLSYDVQTSFKPVAHIVGLPLVIVANPAFPANTIPEMIALAKARPADNPIFFASAGTGSLLAFTFELLQISESFKMKQAPYAGTAQMTTDIIGNQVPLGALAVATVAQHIKSGRLKALAVTTAKRSSSLPNVPSVAEQGIKGFDVQSWVGLLAPAATPDATVAQIYADIATVANTSGFIEQMQGQGMELDLKNPAQFKIYIAAEVSKWTTVVKEAGIKP